jgi:Leucine-rich repeat (LRR) protein
VQHRHVCALHISYNKLVALPAELAHLECLTLIGIDELARPPNSSFPRLTASNCADATHNEIAEVHEQVCTLPRLNVLELAFNRLQRLPDDLGKLTSLDRLTLQVAHARA